MSAFPEIKHWVEAEEGEKTKAEQLSELFPDVTQKQINLALKILSSPESDYLETIEEAPPNKLASYDYKGKITLQRFSS